MEEERRNLHIFMLPWLAMGHLLPFFELSKQLAFKGIKISFFSTPSNILRLPPVPQTLTPFLNLIPCSVSSLKNNLPSSVENTNDLQSETNRSLLDQVYADFEQYLTDFLSNPLQSKPDWIIYDFFAKNWAPSLASRFNFNSAFFSVLQAASIATLSYAIESPEDLTKVPDLLSFATAIALRPFEARRLFPFSPREKFREGDMKKSQLLIIKSCREYEGKWLDLLGDKYTPVGLLPPSLDNEEEETETWMTIREWLNKRENSSVIYAAFGSEVKLTEEEIEENGLGLEKSGSPFVWVLRAGSSPPQDFEERTIGRGLVWIGWAPQSRLLAHPAVGGFLCYSGSSSILEGLVVGAVMVVLPMIYDQGLNARHLVESGYAVEVERDDEDGSFSGEDIGRKLRMVMVEDEGEELRKKATQGKEIFGSEKLHDKYIDELVKKLW